MSYGGEDCITGKNVKHIFGHPDIAFIRKKLSFLLTVNFGTDTIAAILAPPITRSIGAKKGSVISNTTKK